MFNLKQRLRIFFCPVNSTCTHYLLAVFHSRHAFLLAFLHHILPNLLSTTFPMAHGYEAWRFVHRSVKDVILTAVTI
jgi:hypothetical protein